MIYIMCSCPMCDPRPQSPAEELLDVIETGFRGYVFDGKRFVGDGNITENQAVGLIVAEELYTSPIYFKFRALVEQWSLEKLEANLRELKCTSSV